MSQRANLEMNKLIYLFLPLVLLSCSSGKLTSVATAGTVAQQIFNKEIGFNYVKNHIFINVAIQQKNYTFLFDTGNDVTIIDPHLSNRLDFQPVTKYEIEGSSFEEQKIQYGFLSSLSIEDVLFQNIGIGVQDLSFIKNNFPDQREIFGNHWRQCIEKSKVAD